MPIDLDADLLRRVQKILKEYAPACEYGLSFASSKKLETIRGPRSCNHFSGGNAAPATCRTEHGEAVFSGNGGTVSNSGNCSFAVKLFEANSMGAIAWSFSLEDISSWLSAYPS
ncbi:MAG TPA: hypothetical protein VGK48_27110 [Terriglobia bacterium]|jgi:hypothetical protein